ncbi:MAG: ATP-dependent DNA helicase RecG [Acidobacteriota bacterium]|jgi:ATP-dependent DNA helicase RecG
MKDILDRRLQLHDAVIRVPGVGPARASLLAAAGIDTVEDLLLYLPFRYEDRATVVPVAQLVRGQSCALRVVVERCRRVGRGRRGRVEATVSDASGKLRVVWFQQPYVANSLHVDDEVWLYGKVGEHDGKLQLANPVFEKSERDAGDATAPGEDGDDDPVPGLHVGRLVPIYRRIGKLGPALLRRLIAAALQAVGEVPESLPERSRQAFGLLERRDALRHLHDPPDDADVAVYNESRSPAHRRLVCEEFLAFQTALQLQRPGAGGRERGVARAFTPATVEAIIDELPFVLTVGQQSAVEQVLTDLRAPAPMHRLLQGDVGCGKTVVAGCAMLAAAASGCQAALMAPTEILARQHLSSLTPWAAARGVPIACLTGSTPTTAREGILAGLADGSLPLVVGTHALIEETVRFADLGLAVVDEQHRFGVRQRAALRDKGAGADGTLADLLVMTATPIPRSLALTLYGDLDVCTIPDLPPGRRPVDSEVMPAQQWGRVVKLLREAAARGEQAYVVAPRIEVGDDELAAAVRLESDLRRQLPDVTVGLVHGSQSNGEKLAAMQAFVQGQTDVLAATTVIEVGVDVPNATLMVVGHAESFGLAQLHQLRGRVGRGELPSSCLFIAHPPLSAMADRRLRAIVATNDGFVLAEQDLLLRGPGEVLGTRQAGLAALRVGDPLRDHRWLKATRAEAHRLARADDPESCAYRERVRAYWQRRFAVLRAG